MAQSFRKPLVDLQVEAIPEEEERDISEKSFVQPDTPQFEAVQTAKLEPEASQPVTAQTSGFSLGSLVRQLRK